jgi:hypothetical protein
MFDAVQVGLNENEVMCGAFAEPSDGREPSTPPYQVLAAATGRN